MAGSRSDDDDYSSSIDGGRPIQGFVRSRYDDDDYASWIDGDGGRPIEGFVRSRSDDDDYASSIDDGGRPIEGFVRSRSDDDDYVSSINGGRPIEGFVPEEHIVWGRDSVSIDGRVFYMKRDLEKRSPGDEQVIRRYLKQVEESEGFDIVDYPGHHSEHVSYVPTDLTKESSKERVTQCAIQGLDLYNKLFKKQFVFSRVLWATHLGTGGILCHVTFEAVEGGRTDDPAAVKKFQVKACQVFPSKEIKVFFCRLRKEQEVAFEPFVYPTRDAEVKLNAGC